MKTTQNRGRTASQNLGIAAGAAMPPALTPHEIRRLKEALNMEAMQQAAAGLRQAEDCQAENAAKEAHYYGGEEVAKLSPRPFDMVEDAAARVGNVAARISALAARLVGEAPPSPCDVKSSRFGQLGTVADHADSIFYAVNAMHGALDRIEKEIP